MLDDTPQPRCASLATLLWLSLLGAACTGPPGPVGSEGAQGDPGLPGLAGAPGLEGQDGRDGRDFRPPDAGGEPDASPPYECPPWTAPPGLGGVQHAVVSLELAEDWKALRSAREEERMLEAYKPQRVTARYRIEQAWIDEGCVDLGELVDLGRGLFLRNYTLDEGLGNGLAGIPDTLAGDKPAPNLRRFQSGHFGGPDAIACINCHWKGGLGSGGDRADNTFFRGDGDDILTHDERNPLSLWGSGWAELIAQEMSEELQSLADTLTRRAIDEAQRVEVELIAKGIRFGTLSAAPDGEGGATLDTSDVDGVDSDLVVKPFGWKGVFTTLREFIAASLQLHMNLQAEELVANPDSLVEIDLGEGPTPDDPDNDGVVREITEGQLTALVSFLATLDTPIISIPTDGKLITGDFPGDFEIVTAQEFTWRWGEGAEVFQDIGCPSCHIPFMTVRDPVYRTRAALSDSLVEIDLSTQAAEPRPSQNEDGLWLVPVFSDFKRHDMGEVLAARHVERGVPETHYITRRLWGLANTRPYMHDGSATLFDEAIGLHGGEGAFAAAAFANLPDGQKASLRVFLLSLRRAPTIRVR